MSMDYFEQALERWLHGLMSRSHDIQVRAVVQQRANE